MRLLAGKTIITHGGYALHDSRHRPQIAWRNIAKPQAVTVAPFDEFIWADVEAKELIGSRLLRNESVLFVCLNHKVAAVDRERPNGRRRHIISRRFMAIIQKNARRIQQVTIDITRLDNLAVFVNRLFDNLYLFRTKADNDTMNGGVVTRLVVPFERAIGKVNFDIGKVLPEGRDLLALRD